MTITATFETIEELRAFANEFSSPSAKILSKQTSPPVAEAVTDIKEDIEPVQAAIVPDDDGKAVESRVYSLPEVRAKLAALNKEGKKAAVQALLDSFGVSKLSQINASDYPALMEKAGEI